MATRIGISRNFSFALLVLFASLFMAVSNVRAEEEADEMISSPPPQDLAPAPKPTPDVSAPKGPPNTFKFGSGDLLARVEHPFRVVELETGSISATLHADRMDLPSGLSVEAHISAASLVPPGRLGGYISARLMPDGPSQEIVFRSHQADTLVYDHDQKPVGFFDAIFTGKLQAGGGEQIAAVRMKCMGDGPTLKCHISSRFSISGFGIPVPRMLWVKAKDEVSVEGEVSFAPQR
jgi:hypothetical protein